MMPSIYGVWVPPQYYEWMKMFNWLQLNIFALAPAGCLGDYNMQLVFLAITPLFAMMAFILLAVMYALGRDWYWYKSRRSSTEGRAAETTAATAAAVVDGGIRPALSRTTMSMSSDGKHVESLDASASTRTSMLVGLAIGTPPAVIVAFCVLPSVSSGLFAAFDCERFVADDVTGEAHHYLSSDLAIRCSSGDFVNPTYEAARSIALGFITVWPLGMPIATLILMFSSRRALLEKRATFLTRAFGFLHREYRASCYWWEVVEMLRRLLLTGAVLLIIPPEAEAMRLLFAQVVTLCSLCAVGLIQPYKRSDNNTLAFAAQLMLLFVLTLANAMKLYKDIEDTAVSTSQASSVMGFSDPFGFSAVVFSVNVVMALLTVAFISQQAYTFTKARNQRMRQAVAGLTQLKYPVNLVSLRKFQSAGRLVPHEAMRDAGALTVFDLWGDALSFSRKKVIVFFSHRKLPAPPLRPHAVRHREIRRRSPSHPVYIYSPCVLLLRMRITSRVARLAGARPKQRALPGHDQGDPEAAGTIRPQGRGYLSLD